MDKRQEKAIDVIALGDLILNLTYAGKNADGIACYERQPAGATANMLVQVARLGGSAALIGKLGNDEHSRYLFDYVRDCGVDMTNVRMGDRPTRIMFVYSQEDGDRYFSDFQMERNDIFTSVDEVDYEMVKSSKYLNIKCMPFAEDLPIAATFDRILQVARENDVRLSVDAQWRGNHLTETERETVRDKVAICDVVKLTDVEMAYYYGESDLLRGTERILWRGETQLVALTLDNRGCLLRTRNASAYMPAYCVNTIDTTGAGDSFMGALLYRLCRSGKPMEELGTLELGEIADFCNACAALSTTHRGSLAFMPDLEKVKNLQRTAEKYPPYQIQL